MKIITYLIPVTFLGAFLAGAAELFDTAYLLLAISVGLLIGYLALETILDYIICDNIDIAEYEDNIIEIKKAC